MRKRSKYQPGKRLPRLHQMLLTTDGLPTVGESRITMQKLILLQGIADLKAGKFGYQQVCQFKDFISLALSFCDQFQDEALRPAANECAEALTGIMNRYTERQVYVATGDEIKALQGWVEEIADYMGSFPDIAIRGLVAEVARQEIGLRKQIAARIRRAA
jgi:hypothetical protein